MASDTSSVIHVDGSVKSFSSKARTPSEGGKRVGFARPTLIIPPSQSEAAFSRYGANLTAGSGMYTAGTGPYSAGIGPTPEMYGRKASMFMFSQLNGIKDFTMNTAKSGLGIGEKCSIWMYNKIKSWSRKWFTHCFLSIVLIIYTVGGAAMFANIEGPATDKLEVRDTRSDTYDLIRRLRNLSIDIPWENSTLWNENARVHLNDFKLKLIEAHVARNMIEANRGIELWTLMNAIVYCATIYTSIGYGHICPKTITGKALTIVYALIGIPLFLIALTDFGKLFTRGIKFLWSFVRRLYYTGSCRRARKRAHVQEIFKGAQMMYEIATFRRPSMMVIESPENIPPHLPYPSVTTPIGSIEAPADTDTPTTPALSNFEIDDEFNLPISVALFILISYIFVGALIYCAWEGWNFFASFYFVFISMSTIGFGDYVPRHPICMIVSIVYLVFGLALMSMCINVVQEKLSDTFKKASAKLGATIGFEVGDDGSVTTVPPEIVEMPDVHNPPSEGKIDGLHEIEKVK